MISDALSDAVGEIEEYQRDLPDSYAEITAEIDVVKTVMDGLRMVFDAVPGQPVEYERLIAELRSAILALDVSSSDRESSARRLGGQGNARCSTETASGRTYPPS